MRKKRNWNITLGHFAAWEWTQCVERETSDRNSSMSCHAGMWECCWRRELSVWTFEIYLEQGEKRGEISLVWPGTWNSHNLLILKGEFLKLNLQFWGLVPLLLGNLKANLLRFGLKLKRDKFSLKQDKLEFREFLRFWDIVILMESKCKKKEKLGLVTFFRNFSLTVHLGMKFLNNNF